MSKLMKTWLYIIYIVFSIGMVVGFVYMSILTGSAYIVIYQTLGLSNMIMSFIVGLIFYIIMFYGIYRLDLFVKKR